MVKQVAFKFQCQKIQGYETRRAAPRVYKMTNNTDVTDLEFTEMEKDLGIHVDNKL